MLKPLFFVISTVVVSLALIKDKGLPCKARQIEGQSVVCVCDANYCDEIIREKPTPDYYIAYASSKSGLRFYKDKGHLQEALEGTSSSTVLDVNLSTQYQTIEGFGGGISDAAAMNWMSLEDSMLKQKLIDSYFSTKGLEYNMIRTPIGGTDCSSRKYALNELPVGDKNLANFSLAYEDYEYKIPMFKAAARASIEDLYVVATVWSPPDWMKVSNDISVCGKLNPEYYQTYADYYIKFMEGYYKQGIKIWGITTTNEPFNAFISTMVYNCMGWTSSDQAKWIVKNLGPSLRASKFNETLIFANDDQRYSIPFLFNELVSYNPDVLKYIDGVAVHGYADEVLPPSLLSAVTKPFPDLKLLSTEFCVGYLPYERHKVELGSWKRAETYVKSIMGNLNYGSVGYIDWNLCMNKIGGPNWALNFVDSPIIVNPEMGQFLKQPTYYAMGHFAKFIPRGSKRVDVDITKTMNDLQLQNVAFLTPDNTVVVVMYNPLDETRATIKLGSKAAVVMVPAASLVTVEMVVDESSYEMNVINTGPVGGTPDSGKSSVSSNPEAKSDTTDETIPGAQKSAHPKTPSPDRRRGNPRTQVHLYSLVVLFSVFICGFSTAHNGDKPCAALPTNVSVVCVCNATYCDEITRETPSAGTFNVYTSSNSGLRFFKTSGALNECTEESDSKPFCSTLLDLDLSAQFQYVEGFGGAVSDSASITWSNITDERLRNYLIESYFGEKGIEYNMIRVPIGSTDFSTKYYSYNEQPENQTTLTNYTLAPEDYDYKIPMIKAALKAATDEVHIVASAWGAPLWMKTRHQVSGIAEIKEEYYGAFAEYHYKFLEQYSAQGIDIWGLTSVNEPLSGPMNLGENVRVTWTVRGLGQWIAGHLGPMIRNSTFKNVKIMTGDDQRMLVPLWFNMVVLETPEALNYIDGVAVHFYFDEFTPADMLTVPMEKYPGKFVLYTEASIGIQEFPHVYFGSWERAQRYARNIIEDLNYNVIGWIDWNLCLNPEGGPSWIGSKLDSPIIVFAELNQFFKQPMYYALGHFSKFIPRGSRRLGGVGYSPCEKSVDHVSFVTPRGTVVTVLHNENKEENTITIRVGEKTATVTLPPESIATVESSY